jgi:hypothetical protein
MTDNYSVGAEITAWCTKCKLELGHTIVAMVENAPKRVECNTCHGKHNYKLKPATRTTTKKTTRKRITPEITYNEHLQLLTGGAPFNTINYKTSDNFEKDNIIQHSKFGTGIVLAVLQPKKIEVLFKEGSKLLAQNL